MPTRAELIAAHKSNEEIRKFLQVDKLLYQTIPDLAEAVTRRGKHYFTEPCMACLTGKYPVGKITEATIRALEKKRTEERKEFSGDA
jgi:amidophosphoribosyltransferase